MQRPWERALLCAGAIILVLGLTGCSDIGPEREGSSDHDGSLRGELTVVVTTLDDGTSQTAYYLNVDGDEQNLRRLRLKSAPDLPSGTQVKVWGVETGDVIDVSELVRDQAAYGDVGTLRQPLINGAKQRDRTFAWVFVDTGGGAGTLSSAEATRRLFGTNPGDNSTKQYF